MAETGWGQREDVGVRTGLVYKGCRTSHATRAGCPTGEWGTGGRDISAGEGRVGSGERNNARRGNWAVGTRPTMLEVVT